MSDVTATIEQEAVADSLLGDPQPTETTDHATTGTEAEVSPVEETPAEVEAEPTEEAAENWLPTEQDKVFPDEVYARYAQRYQLTPEQAADPLLRQLLHDKINSDIYLEQQREQETLEELEPAPEPTRQEAPAPTIDEHFGALAQWANRNTPPEVAQKFANDFMAAFNVRDDKGNLAPASPEVARALTQTMSTFGLNLIQTALPQILAPMLENVMPGFSGMYYQSARASSWDTIRNSSDQFASLPAYGSKEFVALCSKLDAEYPALTEMGQALERANGGQLHGPAADKFYSTLAKLATRQSIDPQLLAQAAQAGAKRARAGEVRRSAGNLGAGQSKGAISQMADDDPLKEGYELYKRIEGRL